MLRPYRKGMVGAVMARTALGELRKWGWSREPAVPTKTGRTPRIDAMAQYQRLTGRLVANGQGAKRTCKSLRCA